MNYIYPHPLCGDYGLLQRLVEFHTLQQRSKLENMLASIPKLNRCMARIHDNTQCTRKYRDNETCLCGSHINSLPYGRIDDPNTKQLTEKKFTNRKIKSQNSAGLNDIDVSQYIKTEIICIDGNEYLIDENNVLYENSDTNIIRGRKLSNDAIEWF